MSVPEIDTRSPLTGVLIVWAIAAVVAVLIGVFVPIETRGAWMGAGLGLMVPIAFAVQLWAGGAIGFIQRLAWSVLGSLVVMAVIGLIWWLVVVFTSTPVGTA